MGRHKAAPKKPGSRGQDHYHVPSPDSTGKRDAYLDHGGDPVPDGSKKPYFCRIDIRLQFNQAVEASELHDAELSQVETHGTRTRLVFSNISLSLNDDRYYRAVVDLLGVRRITLDDKPVAAIVAQGDGASVIAFRRSGNTATLLLNWRYYSARRSVMALYRFEFDDMRLRTECQDSFVE